MRNYYLPDSGFTLRFFGRPSLHLKSSHPVHMIRQKRNTSGPAVQEVPDAFLIHRSGQRFRS